jgi:glycosyltransferase involved in cell wall biosynthesis
VTADSRPQTTVVVPVWDEYAGAPLTSALESLVEQNAARILVVDNASRVPIHDRAGVEIVRAPRRLTLGAARNLGLEHVKTPYVIVWDADDLMLPGTIATLESAIKADSRLAAFGAAIVEEPSRARHRWPRRWIRWLVRTPPLFALLDCVWSLYPTTGATIMRTDLVRDAGGYSDAEAAEDWGLGVALAFRGRIGWTERPGRIYLLHHQSVWARHMSPAHQLEHGRAIRRRIKADPRVGLPVKLLLPLIGAAQVTAVAVHVAVRRQRGVRR